MTITIRCSSLSSYSDCPRRAAAKMFFKELSEEYEFDLNPINTSVGAAVGTAMHKALEEAIILRSKGSTYTNEMKTIIKSAIIDTVRNGITWDNTTYDIPTAEYQAFRQANSILDIMPNLQDIKIESEFVADLGDDFILSGHIDIRGKIGNINIIQDFKSGTTERVNIPQYGGYSLLVRNSGEKVDLLREIYIKRIGKTKAQSEPIIKDYDPNTAENFAWNIIKRIKEDMKNFRKTGDVFSWIPNPNSMMCSPYYCPAYGTKFCKCHLKEKGSENVK